MGRAAHCAFILLGRESLWRRVHVADEAKQADKILSEGAPKKPKKKQKRRGFWSMFGRDESGSFLQTNGAVLGTQAFCCL